MLLASKMGFLRKYFTGLSLWHAVLFVILIKLVLLSIDHTPRVFLGDSRSYIYTALTDWVPDDRSYTYGVLIRLVTGTTHRLRNLIKLQTLFMTAASVCVVITLRRYLSAPVWLAGLAGIVCAAEPLQLFSERFVMAEVPSLFFFALYATLAFRYLKFGDFLSLLVMPALGAAAISFRVSFLPAVLFSAVALPLMAPPALDLYRELSKGWAALVRNFPARRATVFALQLMLSIGLTTAELHIYKSWYGKKSNGPPAYMHYDGFVLLCFVAPVLSANDFPDPGLGKRVLSRVTLPLRDPGERNGHLYTTGGLLDALLSETNPLQLREGGFMANQLANKTAVSAILHHPVGMVRLVLSTVASYFDRHTLRIMLMADEFQNVPIDKTSQEILRQVGFNGGEQPVAGPIVHWHFAAWPWYMFLVIFPPIYTVAVVVTASWRTPQYLLLVAYSWAFFLLTVLTLEAVEPRYETPMAWLAPLATAALFVRPAGALALAGVSGDDH